MTTIVIKLISKDTFIEAGYPDKNHAGDDCIIIGLYYNTSKYRGLLQFDLSALPEGSTIASAILRMYMYSATNDKISANIAPYTILQDWDENTVTWNSSPDYNNTSTPYSVSVLGPGWYEWDITKMVDYWYNKIVSNYGLIMISDELTSFSTKTFFSSHNTENINLTPELVVTYTARDTSISIDSRRFTTEYEQFETSDKYKHSLSKDLSMQTLATFFVYNQGSNPAKVYLEISPDNNMFITDSPEKIINPGEAEIFIPLRFSNYAHLSLASANTGQPSTLKIWYQAQV